MAEDSSAESGKIRNNLSVIKRGGLVCYDRNPVELCTGLDRRAGWPFAPLRAHACFFLSGPGLPIAHNMEEIKLCGS